MLAAFTAIGADVTTPGLFYRSDTRVVGATNLYFVNQHITNSTIDGVASSAIATNSAANKLDITNGTAVNLSVSGTLTPSSPASRSFSTDADLLYSLGDSFTFGAGATTYTNTYVSKLAASLGLSAVNIANGSFSIADANWIIFPGWTVTNATGPASYIFSSPSAITEDQNWTALIGFNDLRTGSGTGTAPSAARYRLGLDHLLRYLSIPDSAKRWAVSPDASTGTWTESTWTAYTNKAATSSSGTLTFSNVIAASEISVGVVFWATNYGGDVNLTVDGASIETRSTASATYGNREYINGTDSVIPDHVGPYGNGKIDFCPHVITATGLGLGAHTVVITASGGPVTVIWVAGNGWKRTLREGPNVFLGTIPRQSPWTGAGTDALQASYNSQLRSAINTARSAGLRVAVAPVGEYYDPATEQSVDGVHPDNAGHTTIAGAFEQGMSIEMPQMADVGYQSEPSQTGSFTTLSVSGTSSLVGNVTMNGRLLVLPTATSGGTSLRFGSGAVAASAMQFRVADTALDGILQFTGNSIWSEVNGSNGTTNRNLSLGQADVNTAIQGSATVGTTLEVDGVTTINNRLLVLPDAGGSPIRFGATGTAVNGYEFNVGTAIDRRWVWSGNLYHLVDNQTGLTEYGFNLGAASVNVGVMGSATVGTTLGVTGASTFTGATTSATNVTVNGPFDLNYAATLPFLAITANATLTDANYSANINDTAGSVTVALPTAVGRTGQSFVLKKTGGSNTTTIDPDGSETIDGAATYVLGTAQSIWIESNGTAWAIKGSYGFSPTVETLSYSGSDVTVTAGKGPLQRSLLTAAGNFNLLFASGAQNDGGTIYVAPAATNCTVTLASNTFGPSGTTLTIAGGTGNTNFTKLAWEIDVIDGTNRVSVNAVNYYR